MKYTKDLIQKPAAITWGRGMERSWNKNVKPEDRAGNFVWDKVKDCLSLTQTVDYDRNVLDK